MEFTLMCPNDGQVNLGLEDISAVVFKSPEQIDVVFVCPECGMSLRAELRIPSLMIAAMELAQRMESAEEAATPQRRGESIADATAESEVVREERQERERREHDGERYCEYFRWELDQIECVEDLLARFD